VIGVITVKARGVAGIDKSMGGVDGYQEITVPEGSTLRALLDILVAKFGEDFRKIIYRDESKELRRGLRPLINGRDIGVLGGLDVELQDGDRISLLPPLSGG
jgi:molybdopterin synthase sulfur carrier subunit